MRLRARRACVYDIDMVVVYLELAQLVQSNCEVVLRRQAKRDFERAKGR